jgi:hypothetical protein
MQGNYISRLLESAWVIAPVEESYPLKENVVVSPLAYFLATAL